MSYRASELTMTVIIDSSSSVGAIAGVYPSNNSYWKRQLHQQQKFLNGLMLQEVTKLGPQRPLCQSSYLKPPTLMEQELLAYDSEVAERCCAGECH